MAGRAHTVPDADTGLPRKPMATARRVSLFEREVRVHLSTPALELLFEHAQVLSEGQRQAGVYFGSTMVTFDLARLAELVRDECDAAAAVRIAELLVRDPRVQARARILATSEAARRVGGPIGKLEIDVKSRAAGCCVHLDLDVQGEAGGR